MKALRSRLILTLSISSLSAAAQAFDVSGSVHFTQKAPIRVYLVDEETSKRPFTGIHSLVITPDSKDVSRGYAAFRFREVAKGVYGIRCFQDINGNGRLDKGMFGPSEPWGLSWNQHRTSRWPSFRNFSFTVQGDTAGITIRLTER
ncbi:MAG: DUF2141 domain-containing protein [Spirochaetes bacterium]|nr:DUF2141 domain-containing protein [Spirochaetota bacterium]